MVLLNGKVHMVPRTGRVLRRVNIGMAHHEEEVPREVVDHLIGEVDQVPEEEGTTNQGMKVLHEEVQGGERVTGQIVEVREESQEVVAANPATRFELF